MRYVFKILPANVDFFGAAKVFSAKKKFQD